MITFEEAVKLAKETKKNTNACFEYENGYLFSSTEDEGYYGGHGHTPIVILKKTGKIITMPEFVADGTGKEIGEREI